MVQLFSALLFHGCSLAPSDASLIPAPSLAPSDASLTPTPSS